MDAELKDLKQIMKIKILEYKRYKCGEIKVQSHKKCRSGWKINPDFELHKMLINQDSTPPILWHKEYNKEVKGEKE